MPGFVKLIALLALAACTQAGAGGDSGVDARDNASVQAGFEAGEAGTVSDITGPLSLMLETEAGPLEVRLAELDLPDPEPDSAPGPHAGDTATGGGLQSALQGQAIRLAYDGLQRDRYDRALAQVYRVEDGVWLQAALVEAGRARVLSHKDNRGAAAALLALEAGARAAGLGLWADPANRIRDTDPDALAQDIGSVQLVEGRVIEVTRLRSGRTYINFGADYRTDFTVVVEAADEAAFEAAGRPLADLTGHRIRVRGWIEAENGPLIRIDHPERIEWLEG